MQAFGTLLGAASTAFLCVSVATADEFALDASRGSDTVYFRSSAKLEFIEGETAAIIGSFKFDPRNPSGTVSGGLQVDLRTLKTGIETRDRHMRERHLQTDEFPFAFFELTALEGLPDMLQPDSTYSAVALGMFYIHGIRRELTADLEFRLHQVSGGTQVRARVTFSLNLDEYQIRRPKALFLKLAETIEVEVIFTAHNNLEPSTVFFPAWELVP